MSSRLAMFALGVALLGLALAPAPVRAHGLEPALLSLRETTPDRFDVLWRSSALRLPGARVAPRLPATCRDANQRTLLDEGDRVRVSWSVDCAGGLAGAAIGVDDLGPAAITALLRIERRDGAVIETVLNGRTPEFVVPRQPSRWTVLQADLALGIEHILSGADHMLFVLGLLLLVVSRRQLVQTITAFTLGHSITLSLAALQLTSVPPRPIELLIALSVLLLAVELARGRDTDTPLRRVPWALAVGFGLLHGFGFAGALAEVGLPARDIPLALMAFNLGIEIGQLLFVAVALSGAALLAHYAPRMTQRARQPVVYAMGILAAFWCFQRAALWLG
jgi:hydrogenase/urease accessory protein HupE